MKYMIILGGYFRDVETPILIPDLQDHFDHGKVIAAGFCDIHPRDDGQCRVSC
jgi:hypothetical protein